MLPFVGNSLPLVDMMNSPEIVASALGRIEFLGGGQGCFVFYRNTVSPLDGRAEAQICGRLFLPLSAAPEAIELTTSALIEGRIMRSASLAHLLS